MDRTLLTRKWRQPSAAAAESLAVAARTPVGALCPEGAPWRAPSGHMARGSHMCDPYSDIVSAMPSASFRPCAPPQRRFNALATKAGAISGLTVLLTFTLLHFSFAEAQGKPDASASDWQAYVAGLPALQEKFIPMLRDPEDPRLRQELYKFMYSNLSWGYFTRMYQDESYPDFWPMFNQVYPIGFANPDDSYYQAVIDDKGVYRITGERGSTRIFDVQIGSGPLSSWGTGQLGPTKRNFEIDKHVTVNADGAFEFILSPERPEAHKGDWLPLDPGASFIWIRQIAYDWENEKDGVVTIERLDVPARRGPRINRAHVRTYVSAIRVCRKLDCFVSRMGKVLWFAVSGE